jgi:hypothetical protein
MKPAIITRTLLGALLAAALAGCAGGSSKPATASAKPRSTIVRVPAVMAAEGLEGVIGQDAGTLTQRFGAPRIDLTEGDARKLQFAGKSCVLDIFLYPVTAGQAPTAAHVEARLRQGGAEADRGACIREVEAR